MAYFHSYTYDTIIKVLQNSSVSIPACVDNVKMPEIQIEPSVEDNKGIGPSFRNLIQNNYLTNRHTFTLTGVIAAVITNWEHKWIDLFYLTNYATKI